MRFHLVGGRVELDSGPLRSPGRGAYICAKMECWRAAVRRRGFQRTLRSPAADLDQSRLGDALAGIIANSARGSGAAEQEEPR